MIVETIALILAAGEGARMLSDTPKLLHKVCGTPMLEYVLRALGPIAGERAIVVGHGRERIEEAFHGQATFIYQDRENGWGTGHAVLCARDVLKGKRGQVIVTAGDKPLVLPETYARLADEVRRGNACAMLTDIVQNPMGYGRVIRENGRICAVLRQNQLTGNQFMIQEVAASVYCFDIEALLSALEQLPCMDGEYHLTDVVSIMHEAGLLISSVPALEKSECLGVNDRVQLAQAEKAMRLRINNRHMRGGVTLIDPENTYIQPGVTIAPDTVIHPGCMLEGHTTIDAGCVLYASRILNAHIGAGARVESSVVVDAYVEPGRKIGPFASINPAGRPIGRA